MTETDVEKTLEPRVRVMRIIVLSLSMGMLWFLAIAVYMRNFGHMPPVPPTPTLTYIALIVTCAMLVAQFFVPRMAENAGRRKIRLQNTADALSPRQVDAALLATYTTRLILSCALLEGPGFFVLVAYMLEGQWFAVAVAAVLLGALASKFPTMNGVQQWLDTQRELLLNEENS
jgi:hypothetical protein